MPKRFGKVKTLQNLLKASVQFPSPQRASAITNRFSLHSATSEMSKRFRDYEALRFSLQYKALQRCQSASKGYKAFQGPHMAAVPTVLGRVRGPGARNTDGGPQGRTSAQPALLPRPADQPGPERARAAPQEPGAPGSAT